jgi:phosphoribosyl 1,2-cyclic phosphodiesterase/CheY-like chemotaxis protein
MAKILVIDDDPVVVALLTTWLTKEGHLVSTASDGEAGLQRAMVEKPDVVIADMMMPKLHGLQVVEKIRGNPDLASTKIVASSLKNYPSDVRAALDTGADAFLNKPLQPEEVLKTLSALLKGHNIRVKFWGTRGSIATPGMRTARYGGNTSCTEVRCGDAILILDAGTGLRELGSALLEEFRQRPIAAHIFIGHTHWDHIQGFPFFVPAYVPGNNFTIYSSRGAGKPLERVFRGQMDGDYFPVRMSDMMAHMKFVELQEPVTIGEITVRHEYLNHPGMAVGFRIEAFGKSVVYVSDHECFSRLYGAEAGEREDARIREFCRDADLLIHEAQYTDEEYPKKKGWGHSTFSDAVNTAVQARARRLAIFHHDPAHDDGFMDSVIEQCRKDAGQVDCFAAKEGESLEI